MQFPSFITPLSCIKFWQKITTDAVSPEGCAWWLFPVTSEAPLAGGGKACPDSAANQPCPAGIWSRTRSTEPYLAFPCMVPLHCATSHGICQPLRGLPLSSAFQSSCVCFCLHSCVYLPREQRFQCPTGRAGSYHWPTGICVLHFAEAKYQYFLNNSAHGNNLLVSVWQTGHFVHKNAFEMKLLKTGFTFYLLSFPPPHC